MIQFEEDVRQQTVLRIASEMMAAARTAPKGKGKDTLSMAVVSGDELLQLADKMEEMAEATEMAFFARDAGNMRQTAACVLIGTRIEVLGIKVCGLCGFNNCAAKNRHPEVPCAFNTGDLGIAIGSAVAVAARAHIDNRIMFSAGMTARELGILGREVRIVYAIPLSVSGKSPFFDRK